MLLCGLNGSCQNGIKSLDPCIIAKKPLDANLIKQNAKIILKGKDACVLSLIDSITNYILKNDSVFIECLDSLFRVSDGYVSEYFLEIGTKLFYKKFALMTRYAYRERNTRKGNIEKLLVESLSSELSDTDNKMEYNKKIKNFMNTEFVKNKFSDNEIKYAKQMMSKLDPSKFD